MEILKKRPSSKAFISLLGVLIVISFLNKYVIVSDNQVVNDDHQLVTNNHQVVNNNYQVVNKVIYFEPCQCYRSIDIKTEDVSEDKSLPNTCSQFSSMRGHHQKVVAFTFYEGKKEAETTFDIYKRDYFAGIKDNLALMKKLYGQDWIMRLYYHMSNDGENWQKLCSLVCQDPNFDICDVETNPAFGNISKVFPLNWRFLPAADPQVDLLLVRDLDSNISPREVAAVNEFRQSSKEFHVMRDHPQHDVPILGGTWAIKLDQAETRTKMTNAIRKMFKKSNFYAARNKAGPDQNILRELVWPWAKYVALSHDAYHCRKYSMTKPFPTQRQEGIGNFVGSVISLNNTIAFTKENQCPFKCRPKNNQNWIYC